MYLSRLFVVALYSASFCVLCLFLLYLRHPISTAAVKDHVRNHLVYHPVIKTKRHLQWSRSDALASLSYLGLIVFSILFKSKDAQSAGLMAADLAVVHLTLPFVPPNLLSTAVGVRWRAVRRAHAFFGVLALLLASVHLICVMSGPDEVPLTERTDGTWGFVVSSEKAL